MHKNSATLALVLSVGETISDDVLKYLFKQWKLLKRLLKRFFDRTNSEPKESFMD